MFPNASQTNEIRSIALQLKVRTTDSAEYVAFKCIEALLKKIDKLEKEVKKLENSKEDKR